MQIIPDFVQKIKGLKILDKCILSQIHYLSAQKGYCYAGNEYFVELLSVSCGTIKRSLAKMEKMGLLARKVTWNRRHMHLLCTPVEEVKKEEIVQEKKSVVYSKKGMQFMQSLMQVRRPYTKREAPAKWTQENMDAADDFFHRTKGIFGTG